MYPFFSKNSQKMNFPLIKNGKDKENSFKNAQIYNAFQRRLFGQELTNYISQLANESILIKNPKKVKII